MNRTIGAAVLLGLAISAWPVPVAAQNLAISTPPTDPVAARMSEALSRPVALPVLYVSLGALQAYDVYSTRQAMARGAREANPLMQDAVTHAGTFMAVKAAVVVGTIVAAERLWKRNKAAAIGVLVASNGVAAIVAARNARVLRQLP